MSFTPLPRLAPGVSSVNRAAVFGVIADRPGVTVTEIAQAEPVGDRPATGE
jgi:hypothetical protein